MCLLGQCRNRLVRLQLETVQAELTGGQLAAAEGADRRGGPIVLGHRVRHLIVDREGRVSSPFLR